MKLKRRLEGGGGWTDTADSVLEASDISPHRAAHEYWASLLREYRANFGCGNQGLAEAGGGFRGPSLLRLVSVLVQRQGMIGTPW